MVQSFLTFQISDFLFFSSLEHGAVKHTQTPRVHLQKGYRDFAQLISSAQNYETFKV